MPTNSILVAHVGPTPTGLEINERIARLRAGNPFAVWRSYFLNPNTTKPIKHVPAEYAGLTTPNFQSEIDFDIPEISGLRSYSAPLTNPIVHLDWAGYGTCPCGAERYYGRSSQTKNCPACRRMLDLRYDHD